MRKYNTVRFVLCIWPILFVGAMGSLCTATGDQLSQGHCQEVCTYGCAPDCILLFFTCSAYCSCPHKVHTVACSMHITWTYCTVMTVRLELRLRCPSICWSPGIKFWSTKKRNANIKFTFALIYPLGFVQQCYSHILTKHWSSYTEM